MNAYNSLILFQRRY